MERPSAVRQRLVDLAHLGAPEVVATTRITARITAQPGDRTAIAEALGRSLRALHGLVRDLDPGRSDRFDGYLERYDRARDRIDDVVGELDANLGALSVQLAARGQDEVSLAHAVASLRRYAAVASRLDEELDARLATLAATDPPRASRIRTEVQLPVRSRRRDLLLHLGVASQSLLGLRALDAHDESLRVAASLARTTTVTALDTAAVVGRMLEQRRSSTELDAAVESLRRSWRDAAAALDELDRASG